MKWFKLKLKREVGDVRPEPSTDSLLTLHPATEALLKLPLLSCGSPIKSSAANMVGDEQDTEATELLETYGTFSKNCYMSVLT